MLRRPFRFRYIHFLLKATDSASFTKKEVLHALRQQCQHESSISWRDGRFYLIRYDHPQGILRCKHTIVDEAIALLHSLSSIATTPVSIETKRISGTIKSLLQFFKNDDL